MQARPAGIRGCELLKLMPVVDYGCADLVEIFYLCFNVIQLIQEGVFTVGDPPLVHGLVIFIIPGSTYTGDNFVMMYQNSFD